MTFGLTYTTPEGRFNGQPALRRRQTKSGPRPVFPSKISVGSELAKLCNWHKKTTKLEAGDSILSFLDKVFGREDSPLRS